MKQRAYPAAIVFVVCAFTWVQTTPAQDHQTPGHKHEQAQADEHQHHSAITVPIYTNLGSHARRITTASHMAKMYFDQGLRLQYAFNHDEAIRAYRAAIEHDPECGACFWGIALAAGPNINGGMSPENGTVAYEAIQNALQLAENASPVERDLIYALAKRYDANPEAERAPLDKAYSNAMALAATSYPQDGDVQTLYASSLMNLRPWDYWSGDYENRKPNPGTKEALAALETALEINPDNPGACHYYIHAVEAAYPERAEGCADRLASLMPGAGHIVHMPGHVYIRVGRYLDAVRANEHAVHEDENYIADQNPMGVYPAAYYPHNYHFMAFAATMAGMSEKAMEASHIVAPKIPKEIAKEVTWIQNAVVFPQLTAVTFGKWDEILAMPEPDQDLYHAAAMDAYARGVAHAAKGQASDARMALKKIGQLEKQGNPDGDYPIFEMASHALEAEIALRSGNAADAARHFETAVVMEDAMNYEEPPLWYYPLRHSLGYALLEAGRADEAEAVYRKDLARFRKNGWALYGLAKSLEQQGKMDEAKAAWDEFEEAWVHADVQLQASRF
ncbi:MAG: tetratricopeptide repeat protein [Rhodothermales bacterium]|nr:tetratricopeptide repeat protein [Rhodothermales bacterium]